MHCEVRLVLAGSVSFETARVSEHLHSESTEHNDCKEFGIEVAQKGCGKSSPATDNVFIAILRMMIDEGHPGIRREASSLRNEI